MMISPQDLLAQIPTELRSPLIDTYKEIRSNYSERRWEPAALNGGKFSEVVYTVIQGALTGAFPKAPAKPPRFAEACRALENTPTGTKIGDRSLRILIPRTLVVLYEIRNNRGVGHVGGDVDPNLMDATTVLSMANWVMAELVRVFHNVTTQQAQDAVDTLIERTLPIVWSVADAKRVLDLSLSAREQALVLLYSEAGWVKDADLIKWTEYTNSSKFRGEILGRLHKERLIEYNRNEEMVMISPLGIDQVEKEILKSRN